MINEKTWGFSPETYALLRKKQTAEIDAWLDEHVAQETGYVLDDSLTLANAAAQAKAVGDEIARVDNALVIGMNALANAAWSAVNTAYTAGKAVFAYTYSNDPVLYELVDCYEESMIGYERKDFIFRAVTASNASGAGISTVLLKRTGNGVSYEYEWSDASTVSLASQASLSTAEQMILASFPTDSIENATIASFPDGADGIPVKALTVNITPVQSGSGDPSPTNVRPISGWDAVRYIRSADAGIRPKVGTWTGTTGSLVFDGKTFHRNFMATATALNLIPSAAVPEVLQGSAVAGRYYCHLNYSGTKSVTGIKFEFATPDGTDYVYIDNGSYGTVKSTFTFNRVFVASIEGGGFSAGDYFDLSDLVIAVEPDTASISLGQTVYGGTLTDNGDGTWILTVTHANIASYAGESINEPWISSMDVYAAGATPTTGAQVVYPLTTPVTYDLTADSVKTLLGQNNVFADCGDIAALTYRADVGLYIDKKLAEA